MTEQAPVLVTVREGVATVTVNRPEKLNALDRATLERLTETFEALGRDENVRGVVLTGAGEKAFVAGADIGELAAENPIEAKATAERGHRLCAAVSGLGKPVVAAINGYALGGGLELALACHLRTASETAKLGLPEVTLGILPGYGGTQRLPRLVGLGRGLEMILSGQPVDARTALEWGLVNRVFPPAELLEKTEKWLRRLLANGPLALRYALEAVLRGMEAPLEAGLALEADLFGTLAASADRTEGLRAFLEKRRPEFRGQ